MSSYVDVKMKLDPEDRVLFIMNDMAVIGATRFQKHGFLLWKQYGKELQSLESVYDGFKFYDDWIPYYFGPYSRDLKADIAVNVKNGIIKEARFENTMRYTLTIKGRVKWRKIFAKSGAEMDRIGEKIRHMSDTPLYEMLKAIYKSYPQYAIKSKIRDELRE